MKAFILILLLPLAIFSQSQPNKVDQTQPKDILAELKVKTRTGLEYQYTDSTFYQHIEELIPDTQSVSWYTTKGFLSEKHNYWNYSSAGTFKKSFAYDPIRKETFFYSEPGTLIDWTIVEGKNKYKQEYQYNKHNKPSIIKVTNSKKRMVRKDSIMYVFDKKGRPMKEWSYDINGKLADSLLYIYGQDTLSKKILLIDNQIAFIYYKIKFGSFYFDRVEEYVENHFMGVHYKMYDKKGNLLKERNIHHYTNLNYTKNYIYSDKGLLVEKQIFKDTYKPTHLVLYNYTYY